MLTFLRKKTKFILIVVAVVFVATIFYGLGSSKFSSLQSGREKKDLLAKINGAEISNLRFKQILSRMLSQMQGQPDPQILAYMQNLALKQTIEFTIMLNDAKKHVNISAPELNAILDKIMKDNRVTSQRDFENLLSRMGYSYSDFKKVVTEEMLIQKRIAALRNEVTLSPDDLKEIRARHILIMPKNKTASAESEAKQQADSLLKRIKGGENFETLASKYSQDPGSAQKGGDLGFFTKGSMVPEFDQAAFSLKPGEVSAVIKSPFGYHIIKLDEIRLRENKDKKKNIKETVLAEKQNRALQTWLGNLYKSSKIEIVDKGLKAYELKVSGNIPAAIATYNEAIRENPTDPYLHIFLGDIYRSQGNIPLSIYEYKRSVATNPINPSLRIMLGDLYLWVEKNKNIKADKTDYANLAGSEFKAAASLAGDDIVLREEIIKKLQGLGLREEAKNQQNEISKIKKKKQFEESLLKGQSKPKR